MLKLSILIPVYNAELNIARCLESLIDQNIPKTEYEILIRDDGSSDASTSIIREYEKDNPQIKLFTDTNKGAYIQRNLLLQQAKGAYIYFMDADDYLVRKTLGSVLNTAIYHDTDLTCFDMHLATWEDPDIVTPTTDFPLNDFMKPIPGKTYLEENVEIRHEIWWYLIKKSFLTDLNIIFDESRYHNDVVFTLKLFLAAKRLVHIPYTIYYYFQSPGSIMRKKGRAHGEKLITAGKKLIKDYSKVIESTEQSGASERLLQNLYYTRDKFGFYLLLKMVKLNFETQEFKNIISYLRRYNSYPTKHYYGLDMPKKKFKILNTIFNNRFLLYSFARFRKHTKSTGK